MSDMDQYGPDRPCKRTPCAEKPAHLGGAHLDPASEHYDGPDTTLGALPESCRKAAQMLMHTARREGWDRQVVETALQQMADAVLWGRQQVAAAHVDRDRGINAAIARAEDCSTHGGDLRYERHQAYWFSVDADSYDQQRLAWLGACHDIETVLMNAKAGLVDPEVAAWVSKRIKSASQAQDRIRAKRGAPTHADCLRAGKCEHPDTTPHGACQLDLFDEIGAAA